MLLIRNMNCRANTILKMAYSFCSDFPGSGLLFGQFMGRKKALLSAPGSQHNVLSQTKTKSPTTRSMMFAYPIEK